MPATDSILDRRLRALASSPAVDALLQRERTETERQRSDAAAAIVTIDAKLAADYPAVDEGFRKATANCKAAADRLAKANEAQRAAFSARHNVTALAELARRPHLKILKDTADAAIDELASEVSRAHAAQIPASVLLDESLRLEYVALQAVRLAALKELADLWRESLPGDELAERLAEIRHRCFRHNSYDSIKL